MATSKEQKRRVRDYRARQDVHEHKRRRRVRDNIFAVLAVVVAGAVGTAVTLHVQGQRDDELAALEEETQTTEPTDTAPPEEDVVVTDAVPDASLAEGRSWNGSLTINGVELSVELDGAAAPQAVSALVGSSQDGYYEGKICHRLTDSDDFKLLQCGSLAGDGMGDPDFQYGPIENAPQDDVYPAGTIAMARQSNNPNSNGHQFFVVYEDTTIPSDAAGGYTVVGTVTDGLEQFIDQVVSIGIQDAAPDGPPNEEITIEALLLE